jgi:hexulose-6-phosphate isomerase
MEPLSRRDLFALSAAAALTHTLPAQTPPRPARSNFRKAVKIGMVEAGATLMEKFTILRDCGFDGVELDSPSGLTHDEVLAAKAKSGLEIPGVVDSVHWSKPFSDPDPAVRQEGRKALETALRDAHAFGCSSVLVVPAVVQKKVSYLDAWQRSQAELRQLLPLAAELKVQIAIENVWNKFLLGPTELARYVDELASPWVGVHFDAGNLVTFGYPEHWVPILGKRILKVDVKEFVRGRAGGQGFDAKLNEGDTDWPAVVSALKAIGYDGWFTAEMNGGDAAYLKDLGKRMDAFLKA